MQLTSQFHASDFFVPCPRRTEEYPFVRCSVELALGSARFLSVTSKRPKRSLQPRPTHDKAARPSIFMLSVSACGSRVIRVEGVAIRDVRL